ncbi:glycolate oxidase subunit GlcE [Paracoccus sp. (in: a-proteobacteria)]|uniref:glycolate oxidase subunit GlcE n=1 Tax=Paracoccus sp. TaxID=267 RepID=UPI004059E5C2
MSETLTRDDLAPASESDLTGLVADCFARQRRLRIAGGGTRVEMTMNRPRLNTAGLSGVVTYEPGEMTLIARAGTPLPDIQSMLAAEGQALAFEPPDMRSVLGTEGTPTIGGVVAANASGPRRLRAGACRDHLLGVRFVDGQGRMLKNGGRVMKNVTGLDLSKLLAGSFGTLGVLTQVALKTLPLAPASATLAFHGLDVTDAVRISSQALATPFEVSGAAFRDGAAFLRIEGLDRQVAYRRDRLAAMFGDRRIEVLDAGETARLWRDLRDVAHFAGKMPLWRILAKPGNAPAICTALTATGGQVSLDWGGGLIWYAGPGDAGTVRAACHRGHATLIRRAGLDGPAFPPLAGKLAALSAGLRQVFDPAGIFNSGLMDR